MAHSHGWPTADLIEDLDWILRHDPDANTAHVTMRLHVTSDAIRNACRRADRRDILTALAANTHHTRTAPR